MKKNKKLTLMNLFNRAVYENVQYKNGITDIGDYKYYYSKEYGKRIGNYLINNNVDSKEIEKGSLCSTSSSARLCTNYFYEDDVVFEKPIHNGVSNAATKMDAVKEKEKIFYECKCQEIVYGEHERFTETYKKSKLFQEFIDIKKIEVKPRKNKTGLCIFDLKDLGIDYHGKYYDINFNVKQLICHLIAIAHDYDDKDRKTLQYIIFRPKTDNAEILDLYDKLDKQFKAIQNSEHIKRFCSKEHHNIILKMDYVYIDEVVEHFGK